MDINSIESALQPDEGRDVIKLTVGNKGYFYADFVKRCVKEARMLEAVGDVSELERLALVILHDSAEYHSSESNDH